MRKTYLLLIGFLMINSGNSYSQEPNHTLLRINVERSSQYLPDYLDNVYIGMPLADFVNAKDTSLDNFNVYDTPMWIGVNEQVLDNGIDEVFYKFDKVEVEINPELPLYQINIKFLYKEDQNYYVNETFGEPFEHTGENQNEWIFRTNKNYLLIIKEFEDTIHIIATMAGTEWDTSK